MRQDLSEEKSYRNRAKLLDVIEPELSHFTFELLCFTPVAPVVDQPLQTARHPRSCSFPASQLDEREKNRIGELMGQGTVRDITD